MLDAAGAGSTVYVVEDEKDVHALERAGEVATYNPVGAGKWRADYAESLQAPTSSSYRTATRRAACALPKSPPFTGVAASVRLVEAAEERTPPIISPPGEPSSSSSRLRATTSRRRRRRAAPVARITGDGRPGRPRAGGDGRLCAAGGPEPVRAAIGRAATSELDGDAVWVLLVGGPSCGKTETIDVLRDVADGHIKALTGPGLLSWKAGAGKEARAVGLLARLGDGHHFASITDLSSLLAKSERGGRDDAFALLRDAYDGNVSRDLGTAPELLRWSGHDADRRDDAGDRPIRASHQDVLGPRWAYLRLPELAPEHSAAAAALAYARVAGKSDAQARARRAPPPTRSSRRAHASTPTPGARAERTRSSRRRASLPVAAASCRGRAAVTATSAATP